MESMEKRGLKRPYDDSHEEDEEGHEAPLTSGRRYRSFSLGNGLDVLLVSDKEISQSSAALTVGVGSFADPPDIQGLAHLLEHILFRGSTKFQELDDYLTKNGGDANAHTEFDFTTFRFEVASDCLKDALGRFANVFINPLMETDILRREIFIIDSEFLLAKHKDSDRIDQLMASSSYDNHPLNRFSWGNEESLSNVSLADLRDKALTFFKTHYVAPSMKLAVLGHASLDELESWVTHFFSPLPSGSISPSRPEFSPPWDVCRSYKVQSVENSQRLVLRWIIPPPRSPRGYLKKPESYILQLFSQEGKGSLSFFLKKRKWITSLHVCVGAHYAFTEEKGPSSSLSITSAGRLITLTLELTDEGLKKEYLLVDYIYKYLSLLAMKGIPQHFMEEYKILLDMKFRSIYIDDHLIGSQSMFADLVSANMLLYGDEHAVSFFFSDPTCDQKEIGDFLKLLTPEKMRIYWVVRELPKEQDHQMERWFGTSYIEVDIPTSHAEAWLGIKTLEEDRFSFPPKNKLMPRTFFTWIRSALENYAEESDGSADGSAEGSADGSEEGSAEGSADGSEEGSADGSEEGSEDDSVVQKIGDNVFYVNAECLSSAYFCFSMPSFDHIMNKFYVELLEHSLSPLLFKGSEAYIDTSISIIDGNMLVFQFDGFHEKFNHFISKVWDHLKSFTPSLQDYEVIKEKLLRDLHPTNLLEHADQLFIDSLMEAKNSKALDVISFSDIQKHMIFSDLHVQGVIFGLIPIEEAKKIADLLDRAPTIRRNVVALLPCGARRLKSTVRNDSDVNSLSKVFYEIPCIGLVYFFFSMIAKRVYRELSIVENLGYDVGCQILTQGIKGVCVSVISPQHEPSYLMDRIRSFISGFKIDRETFDKHRKLAKGRLDNSGPSIWELVVRNEYSMDLFSEAIKSLDALTLEEVRKKYDELFGANSRRVEVCIYGCNTKPPKGSI